MKIVTCTLFSHAAITMPPPIRRSASATEAWAGETWSEMHSELVSFEGRWHMHHLTAALKHAAHSSCPTSHQNLSLSYHFCALHCSTFWRPLSSIMLHLALRPVACRCCMCHETGLMLNQRLSRFLMDTFGQEQLKKGSGVLDIAGGKGELSFELLNLNGIQATVVEPRALQLWRQHKWMLVTSHSLPI